MATCVCRESIYGKDGCPQHRAAPPLPESGPLEAAAAAWRRTEARQEAYFVARARAALEVARGALEAIRDLDVTGKGDCYECGRPASALADARVGHDGDFSCGIAARALRSMAGAGKDAPAEEGVDLSRCGGCGDPCGVWREDRALGPDDPCAWTREPGIWVFDCKKQDPRMAGEKGGT